MNYNFQTYNHSLPDLQDSRLPQAYDLEELLSEIDPNEELPKLVDWGPPQGNEHW